jgi:RNA polymerase sporulation-specific sigma factor
MGVANLTTSKSFDKPLTPEEEVKYLTRFKKQGDTLAKSVLIERNMRLVAHIAKKYNGAAEEQDDLISIGTIGLIKAIDTYDVDKGTRLATYASKCIENEILMNIRTNKKTKSQVSLQDPIGTDKEGNEISLIDILGTEVDYILDQVELKIQISKLYEKLEKTLSQREKEIVQLRYGLTPCGYKTQREIAQKLKISRSYVSRIEKRALKKLKKELKHEKSLI